MSTLLVRLLLLSLLVIPSSFLGVAPAEQSTSHLALTRHSDSAAPASNPSLPSIDHIVVIMMENHPLNVSTCCGGSNGVIGNPDAPYITGLARNYSLAGNYFADDSGSLPNYLAITGGSTFSATSCVSNDAPPTSCVLQSSSIVDRLESSGRTWKAYMEDYTGGCFGASVSGGSYAFFHNPFPYFAGVQNNTARCNRIVSADPGNVGLPDNQLIADLNSTSTAPNYMWLTPNECDNMHDSNPPGCSSNLVVNGDNYLRTLVPQILGSAVFKTANAALFITWDEPTTCSCPIPALWVGPAVKQAYSSIVHYTHYSFLATVEALWNLSAITANDGGAAAMTEFFNLSQQPSFSLTNSGALSVVQGGSAYTTITTIVSGPSQTALLLSLACAGGAPSGGACSFEPSSYSCSTTCSSSLKISTSSYTSQGQYSMIVTGGDGAQNSSTQFTLSVLTPFPLVGDVTGDCKVNIFDLSLVAGVFGEIVRPGIDPHTDQNLDGKVNLYDLVLVGANLGKTCS